MSDHIVDVNKKVEPEWDEEGNPMNLMAAAEDAYEWLEWMCRGLKSWNEKWKLIEARDQLRKSLDESASD